MILRDNYLRSGCIEDLAEALKTNKVSSTEFLRYDTPPCHSLQTLTTLDLRGNEMCALSAKYLADALKVNRVRSTRSSSKRRLNIAPCIIDIDITKYGIHLNWRRRCRIPREGIESKRGETDSPVVIRCHAVIPIIDASNTGTFEQPDRRYRWAISCRRIAVE